MSRLRCIRPPLAPAPTTAGWKPDAIRGSRHQRGYGAAWDRTRKRIMDRDEGLCQECKRNGRLTVGSKDRPLECDHIVPKSQGGSDDYSNLEMKCHDCHEAKTKRESRAAIANGQRDDRGGGSE